jgi:hypothetical protein
MRGVEMKEGSLRLLALFAELDLLNSLDPLKGVSNESLVESDLLDFTSLSKDGEKGKSYEDMQVFKKQTGG